MLFTKNKEMNSNLGLHTFNLSLGFLFTTVQVKGRTGIRTLVHSIEKPGSKVR